MPNEKYVVFKVDDFKQAVTELRKRIVYPEDQKLFPELQMLDDAVVIRRQDKFAPPALDAYANAIMTTVETLRDFTNIGNIQEVINDLQKTADFFHEQATLSWETERKLPS